MCYLLVILLVDDIYQLGVSFLFLIVVDHTPCSMVSSCMSVFSFVMLCSFLCSSAFPPPCLFILLTVSNLRLLLFRSLVFTYALSSSMFFSQVSVSMMKSMFWSSTISMICSCLFFTDHVFIVAILMWFKLFFSVVFICIRFFVFTIFGLCRYLLLYFSCFMLV